MPQPKKHDSPALRQAAYRARRQQAFHAVLLAKGLPARPVIATLPGWPRWNASLAMAHGLLVDTLGEMQDYFDERSESWQESERGGEHQDRIASVEEVADDLGALVP